MNNYFDVIGVSSEGKELKELEKIEGIKTIKLNMSRKITPIRDFISLLRAIYLILKEKPDIVHTHTPKAGIIGMMASWVFSTKYCGSSPRLILLFLLMGSITYSFWNRRLPV